ncbi:MAG TPA: SiaB family protein kinase [Bacteroidales bacterium]|jgi:hypothetical protein|nr:hypothetical protein [Bacteroidales bacterium]HNR42998.1 SiaB family protein kinase [Bacteroidales bacterium]HPM18925.1 SiaB family protein kinase [Bacteroidales bacterium]HQG78656.1 SiaB family protein kinase [Bacteroidales bacterium]
MSFDVEDYFSAVSSGDTILCFKGNVDSERINETLDTIEEKLIRDNEPPRLRKRVYNVLVESLQNLYHHMEKAPPDFHDQKSERYGMLAINRTGNGYRIYTCNFILNDNIPQLEEKIEQINRSTHKEISELYKFILNHQRISAKGGGGLGLVDIARKTGNKLEYSFKKYNDKYSLFCMNALVREDNKNINT